MMTDSYAKDLKMAVRVLRLNVLPLRSFVMWGLVLVCSFAMVPVQQDLSYPALMAMLVSGVLQQIFLMMTLSDLFVSSPYERDIILRAQNRLIFLCNLMLYLLYAGANYLVTTRIFGNEPFPYVFVALALVNVIYRVGSIFMYRNRALSIVLSALIGATAAMVILSQTGTAFDALQDWTGISVLSYEREIELGITILVLGEIVYRALARAMWKKKLDRRVFDAQLRRARKGK